MNPITSQFLGTAKAKVAALAIAAVVVSTPLLLQRRAVESLKAENGALTSELAKLRHEIANPPRGPLDELERLRRENAELHRLRAEITTLRREMRELEMAWAASVPADEPVKAPKPAQVRVSTRHVEITPEVLQELHGLGITLPTDRVNSVVLGVDQTTRVEELLRQREEGVKLLSAPSVITLDGRQARISMEGSATDENKPIPGGTIFDVLPRVSADRKATTLKIEAIVTESLGIEEIFGQKVPRFRVRKAESELTVREDQTILLLTAPQPNFDGTIPGEPLNKVLVFVSTMLMNPDGTPMVMREP